MEDYVMPIVDEKEARQAAASALYGLRKNTSYREQSAKLLKNMAVGNLQSREK